MPKKISLFEDKLFWTNDATGYAIFKCKVFDTIDVQCESVPIQVFVPIEIFMISQQAKQINGKFHLSRIINFSIIFLLVTCNVYNRQNKINKFTTIFKINLKKKYQCQ